MQKDLSTQVLTALCLCKLSAMAQFCSFLRPKAPIHGLPAAAMLLCTVFRELPGVLHITVGCVEIGTETAEAS